MSFNPRPDYQITPDIVRLKDFDDFPEAFITRPPYQRKTVWSEGKKQALMDSLLRRYYVPKLVFREVRLADDKAVSEIIDGQQRITTVQQFFQGEFKLPKSLQDVSPAMAGKSYDELPVEIKQFVSKLSFSIDRITNIENPKDPAHQKVATDIFWRLQQGESLNEMEVAHARLSSRVRNFLVKYADDITFDYKNYVPIDDNPAKHPFFRIIDRKNDRMQHLSLLARMLLIEMSGGPTDVRDKVISDLIDSSQTADGIGDDSYETQKEAKGVLATVNLFYDLFKGDPMLKGGGSIKELSREYFILSFYMLVRHLRLNYVVDDEAKVEIRKFFDLFYQRWRNATLDDRALAEFSENRQQSPTDLRERELILRQVFFEFLASKDRRLAPKDKKRMFDEAQRIAIYRAARGICIRCSGAGKSDDDATVSWAEYEADHIHPYAAGGFTELKNGQLLCRTHNRSKGAAVDSAN